MTQAPISVEDHDTLKSEVGCYICWRTRPYILYIWFNIGGSVPTVYIYIHPHIAMALRRQGFNVLKRCLIRTMVHVGIFFGIFMCV